MSMNASLQQLIKEAQEAYQTEEFRIAANKYEAAAREYTASGDALMAAEMANNRSVALLKAGDAPAAYQASASTDQVFAAAGDIRRQAVALSNQAAALESQRKIEPALQLYQQSADLFKQVNEPDMRAYVLKSISLLQFRSRKRIDAMATMRIALDAQRKLSLRDQVLKFLLNLVFRLLGAR